MNGPRPYNVVAELTYRCPLRCPYCSNPVDYRATRDTVDAQTWSRVFREAAALGALHVGLTGGEPCLRADLEAIVAGAEKAGLYSLLVTAGTTADVDRLERLAGSGLRSVQLSIQDSEPEASDRLAGVPSFEAKLAFARAVRECGLPLILNVVLHRHNLGRVGEIIELARSLDAERLELANAQYHGWAWVNRGALMPSREQLEAAGAEVRRARQRGARPELVFVLPDFHAGRPKPCMGGWGARTLVVTPGGRVQPCHEAGDLPGLEFWNVADHSLAECWQDAPGMNAFRGEAWMREPCRTCPERGRDFGGCRCQAYRLTGDPAHADPACSLAPHHDRLVRERATPEHEPIYRGDPLA